MRHNRIANLLFVAASLVLLTMPPPALADSCRGVSADIVVPASAMQCYEAIRGNRQGVHVIYDHPEEALLEEEFTDLPVIGSAKCRYKEVYTPGRRVDYTMVHSDKFKAFEGQWILTPIDDKHTKVELSSYIDTGLIFPFVKKLTNNQTLHDVKERLQEIKSLAETLNVGAIPQKQM